MAEGKLLETHVELVTDAKKALKEIEKKLEQITRYKDYKEDPAYKTMKVLEKQLTRIVDKGAKK
jgi:hypothetical protein